MLREFFVKSLRIEKYIKQVVSENNCNFEYHPEMVDRYILNCVDDNQSKYEITLYDKDGECSSGWCTATWGKIDVRAVDSFLGITHFPIDINLSFKMNIDENDKVVDNNVCNPIFSYSYDGGDAYYPCGEVSINLELFEDTVRAKNKRMVWIFAGKSGLGKSYLASIINNSGFDKTVYETDSSVSLPNEIEADVIVIGNKYRHSIEDIKNRLVGECEVISVNFSEI